MSISECITFVWTWKLFCEIVEVGSYVWKIDSSRSVWCQFHMVISIDLHILLYKSNNPWPFFSISRINFDLDLVSENYSVILCFGFSSMIYGSIGPCRYPLTENYRCTATNFPSSSWNKMGWPAWAPLKNRCLGKKLVRLFKDTDSLLERRKLLSWRSEFQWRFAFFFFVVTTFICKHV